MTLWNQNRQRSIHKRQSGTSLIEFSVAAVPILLVGLGCVEIAQWFYIKQAISLALLQAARAGITQHASPQAMEVAFEEALLPLYPPTAHLSSRQRLQRALLRRQQQTRLPPWRIEILSPSAPAFDDFADTRLAVGRKAGRPAINNNYQAEQDQRFRAQGWVNGAGPKSGLSIYQANYLTLRLTYLHEPLLPGMKGLISLLGSGAASYSGQAMTLGGYLPVSQEIQLGMQSHPVDWPALSNGKVIRQQSDPAAYPRALAPPCHGLWCLAPFAPQDVNATNANSPGGAEAGNMPPNNHDSSVDATPPPGSTPGGSSADPANPVPETSLPDLGVAPDDPACGVTLCCVA